MVNAVVFEEVSIPVYLAYFVSIKNRRKMYYLSATRPFEMLLKIFPETALGIKKIDFHVSEITDGREESLLFRIAHHDVGAACKEIMDKMLKPVFAIGAIGSFIGNSSKDKISRYCISNASIPLTRCLVCINAAQWYFSMMEKDRPARVELIINSRPYIDILQAYAAGKGGIVLRNRLSLGLALKRLLKTSIFLFIKPAKLFVNFIMRMMDPKRHHIKGNETRVSVIYANYRDITFDINEKNDFFWLRDSGIETSRLIVYFDEGQVRLDKDAVMEFERRQIGYAVLSDKIRWSGKYNYWIPNFRYFSRLLGVNFAVCRAIVKDLFRGNGRSLYFMKDYFEFTHEYCYWLDFFESSGVKIDVNQHDSVPRSIPMRLALERAGGISVSFQRSDCSVPFFLGASTADAYFAFGPGYIKPFKESEFMVNTLLVSGYMTDYVFARLKEPARRLRQALMDKGAKYIISFFDENSSDEKFTSLRKNTVLAGMYRDIMEKVMRDDSLGLVIKSKRPATLRMRLGSVAGLLDDLCATGRCVVFDKGCRVSSTYPSLCAQASDISIGLLSGGTTILESALSATPGLYLDLERLYAYEQYREGKDVFVFNSTDKLLKKIDELRKDSGHGRQPPAGFDKIMNSKDPFRDGKAGERMGTYLRWILESFDQSLGRVQALERANNMYGDKWGKDKVWKP